MVNFRILGLLLLNLDDELGCIHFLQSQGRCIPPIIGLHISENHGRTFMGGQKCLAVPTMSYLISCRAYFILNLPECSFARLPGDVMDRFLHVDVFVFFLLPKVVGKACGAYLRHPAADSVDLVFRGDRGQHYRDGVEQAAEAHVLVGGRAGEAARLDDGTVWQSGAAFVHDQVGHGLRRVRAVQVVPLGQADVEAGRGDVAYADDTRLAVVGTWRPGDDHRFRERAGQLHAHPTAAHADFTGFDIQAGQGLGGLGLDDDVGAAGGALVVRHLQDGGVIAGAGVGVAGCFAGGRAAVAEGPQVGGDGAVIVHRCGAVEADRERCRAAGRRGRGRGRGRFVLDDHRYGDHDRRARRVGQPLRVRDRERGVVGAGRGVAVCRRGAGGRAAVAEAPGVARDAGAAGRRGAGTVERDLQRGWACGYG